MSNGCIGLQAYTVHLPTRNFTAAAFDDTPSARCGRRVFSTVANVTIIIVLVGVPREAVICRGTCKNTQTNYNVQLAFRKKLEMQWLWYNIIKLLSDSTCIEYILHNIHGPWMTSVL